MLNKINTLYINKDYQSIIDIYESNKARGFENDEFVYIVLSYFYENRYHECLEITQGKINDSFLASLDKYNLSSEITANFLLSRFQIYMNQKKFYFAYKNLLSIKNMLPNELFEYSATRIEKILFLRMYLIFEWLIIVLCLLLLLFIKIKDITGLYYYIFSISILVILASMQLGRIKLRHIFNKYIKLYYRR
jgi:hypothetical protein